MTASSDAEATRPTYRVALSLGANLGDRLAALQGATGLLTGSRRLANARVSAVYETEPVGGPEQPGYLNAVLVGVTSQTPQQLLELAHEVEQEYRRTRETRWGPRTLDVDILAFGDVVSADPELTLPHPRAHERGFVLVPWAQVEPSAELVGHGAVAALAAEATAREGADAVRRTDLVLVVPS
ncbi:MAG TPA: 2-amino-4-hydroxy-6-hydroxymethyldihydropteridine diphosphokinase [Candidatus Nanopelagicales bacterium]|jgi:2-amino-4-hydroxy-6-hydroxymethyldihydropteridine diphosphokinase